MLNKRSGTFVPAVLNRTSGSSAVEVFAKRNFNLGPGFPGLVVAKNQLGKYLREDHSFTCLTKGLNSISF